jgi:hypothetical protein
MPCYNPLQGWYSKHINDSGKRSIVFDKNDAVNEISINIPCGRCIGCRLERSRQWAMRCVFESKLYEDNCFITLTYDDDHIPENGSLVKEHWTNFVKRLRNHFAVRKKNPTTGRWKRYYKKVRYFHCGEYGELLSRPHHHACLFNVHFDDKEFIKCVSGCNLYKSKVLSELWQYGYNTIGDVTFDSAAYVARYVTKKITGEKAKEHYGDREPEYITMSRRPGIGKDFLDKYKNDLYSFDRVVIRNNVQCQPPKYFDNIIDMDNPRELGIIKLNRKIAQLKRGDENSLVRLATKEKVKIASYKQKERSYEKGIMQCI